MLCHYDDNLMNLEYINVTHKFEGKQKKYVNIPRYKCECGYARVLPSVYEFMNKNIDNDLQYVNRSRINIKKDEIW
jgi:hypothetical protein